MNYRIDNLQYCNWSREIFEINREAKLDPVHATIVYHEDFDELKIVLKQWDQHFKENSDLIFLGNDFKDIEKAKKDNKTAIKRLFFKVMILVSGAAIHTTIIYPMTWFNFY